MTTRLCFSLSLSGNWVFEKDFFMMIQDWVQEEVASDLYASTFSLTKFLEEGFDQPRPTCESPPKSILINGRGERDKGQG